MPPLPGHILTSIGSTEDGSLAQLVEQLTFNQLVAGSNPARPTIKSKVVSHFPSGSLAQLVEQLTFNQLVAGSNPARPTIKSKVVSHFPSGSLAQLVEQLTFNQLVAGSNPARPTSYVERRPKGAFLLFYEVRYVALRSYSGQIRRGGSQRNLTSLWIGLAIHGSDASLLPLPP